MGRKERVAGVFGRAAPTYDRVGPRPFAQVGRRLVELAGIGDGDVVLCSLSIFFLDLGRALGEFRRVLRPGGTLGVTTFGRGDPRWDWHRELLRSLMPAQREPRDQAPRPPVLEAAADVEALLASAGFDRIQVHEEAHDVRFAGADEWWEWVWSHGQRGAPESLDEERLERYGTEAYARLPDPIVNTWTILYGIGRRAG